LYITPTKANLGADVARIEPYTWPNCDKGGKNVGWRKTTLSPCQRRDYLREEWNILLEWTLSTSVKGR